MPWKWWLMSPIDTPASALMRRTETPSWPNFFRHASVAAISSSRRASGDSRRNLGSPDVLDRLTGPGAKKSQPTLHVFLVQINARETSIAGVGVARVQNTPVVEQQHRARLQPPAVLQRRLAAECIKGRECPVKRPLLRGWQRERRAIVVVVADLHEPARIVEPEEGPTCHEVYAPSLVDVLPRDCNLGQQLEI